MSGFEETVVSWLTEIAHHPVELYIGVILFLTASSFGLPIPEEVVLITCGMVAAAALEEAATLGNAPTINAVTLATTCFAAVLLSDALVFGLGKYFGFKLLRRKPFSYLITDNAIASVEKWTQKYGALACGIFRFTPGIRFIGHFTCGASKVNWTTFFAVDGLAALISVPTQVLLLAYYGEEILAYIKQFKIALLILGGIILCIWLVKKWTRKEVQA